MTEQKKSAVQTKKPMDKKPAQRPPLTPEQLAAKAAREAAKAEEKKIRDNAQVIADECCTRCANKSEVNCKDCYSLFNPKTQRLELAYYRRAKA